MAEIRVLPQQLVNKIAAGEVVERPSSVVKELMENSLDAGATRIDVTVEDGGKKLVAVTDDGAGMSMEDLALAFASHATSKLASEQDLEAICTMGFRGEALASIASISHAEIRTCRRQDESGYEVSASGGTIGPVRPCAAGPGTTVTVRDLFYNTPARRKFLRTASTEMGHVVDQLACLALPHPKVAFKLTHNGREVHNLPPAQTTRQRLGDLFGSELAEGLLALAGRPGRPPGPKSRIDVEGLIAPPAATRQSGKWQYFFLNGRYVRDRVLSHALREAYRGLIDPAQSPVGFIFLHIDPAEVDVNVHPTKIEVRFRDSQAVHAELLAALKETLNRANFVHDASLQGAVAADGPSPDEFPADRADNEQHQSLRKAMADFFKSVPPKQGRFTFPHTDRRPHQDAWASGATSAPPSTGTQVSTRPACATAPVTDSPPAELPSPMDAPPTPLPGRQAVQIHNSYIVAGCQDGLMIVDQHALHERLIYNDLKRRLADPDSAGLTAQRSLIPETVKVTAAELATLETNSNLLARLGVEVAAFGPTLVAVQQFPSLLAERGVNPGEFLRQVIDELSEDPTADPERLLEGILEMMACKAAIKAGDPLTPAEIDSLLARREAADKASACPHGRPTTLRLTLADLGKQFRRT